MARGGLRRIGNLAEGFNQGYDLVGKVQEGIGLSRIAEQTPERVSEAGGEEAYQAGLEALRQAQAANPERADETAGQFAPTIAGLEKIRANPAGEHYSMGKGKNFKQFAQAPSESEQMAIKSNAMADVISRRDPVAAMRLRVYGLEAQKAGREDADQQAIRSAWNAPDDTQPIRGLQRIAPTPTTWSDTHGTRATPKEADDALSSMGTGGSDVATGSAPVAQPKPGSSPIDPGQAAAAEARLRNASGSIDPNQAMAADSILRSTTSDQTGTAPLADRQSYAAAEQKLQRSAARPAMDAYIGRKVPQIIDTYLKQGNVDAAKKLRDFVDSSEGRDYAHQWSQGVRKLSIGNYSGALKDWQDLYNKQLYDDGRTIKLSPLQDGKQVQAEFFDQAGNQVHSVTYPIDTLARQAGMALAPEKLVEMRAQQDAKRTSEGALLDRQIQLEGMRQRGQEVREDRRDDRLGMRIDAQGENLERRLSAGGGLTPTQQRSNAEIDAARQAIAGMPQSEILRRSQKATNTGRENPDYNPSIARAANLAGRRKIGADEHFDSRTGQPSVSGGDITSRFSADQSMRGMRPGNQTPRGVEVYDQSGRLVGHYR